MILLLSLALAQSPVRAVLAEARVTLDTAYQYEWSAERPLVTELTVLVLDIDPAWLKPSQVDVPVLYVGSVPAERLNEGWGSGHLVVLVPGRIDLTTTPVFFGASGLPERIDAAQGLLAQAAAVSGGARALGAVSAPETVHLLDGRALYAWSAAWILQYAPDETERAAWYRR